MQSSSVVVILSSRVSSVAERVPVSWSGLFGLGNAIKKANECCLVNV